MNSKPGSRQVTLVDGTVTDSYSEAYRHECECRAILAMRNKSARRCYLDGYFDHHTKRKVKGVVDYRGPEGVARLEKTMMEIWRARQDEKFKLMTEIKRENDSE